MNPEAQPIPLDPLVAIAVEAGRRIMAVYTSEFAVTHKDDRSPLTQADLASHHHIVAALAQLTPELPVLSEEAAGIDFATRKTWTRYWLVDPLDGTKEFIKRNGEFTVNIALIDRGRPVSAVVHAPALGTTYAATTGLAWRERDGRREPLHVRRTPQRPALVVSRSHQDAALQALLQHMPEHDAVSQGSSLKFCVVACGEADLYPRTGPTSEWDTAAGQCIVEQAGGQVLQLPELTPLRYNQKDSLLNPGFAVIGDAGFGWVERLRKAA